jgi:tetratricopeptide (TPR) repeat protein
MTDEIACPALDCSFEASIDDVVSHITTQPDENHRWKTLGFENSDAFRHTVHVHRGELLEREGRDSFSIGDYQTAVEQFEDALCHYQRAMSTAADSDTPLAKRSEEVESLISDAISADQIQVVDELIDRAEHAVDKGLQSHLVDPAEAAQSYEKSIELLEDALDEAADVAPRRVPDIERRLNRGCLYKQSLESSALHRQLSELVAEAQKYTSAGDRAFKQSELDVAVEKYEAARHRYESIEEILRGFHFDDPLPDPHVCDVCHEQFEHSLLQSRCISDQELDVCPSCAQFASQGTLLTPGEVESDHMIVRENIESIQEGATGIDWTSEPRSSTEDLHGDEKSSRQRDTQRMLVQLVGVVQTVGRVPSQEELDEQTDFESFEYEAEFRSIPNALREAGFDI